MRGTEENGRDLACPSQRLSNKLRILRVMIFAILDNQPFTIRKHSDPDKVIIRSGGYRPISFFRGPDIGGDAADVRLRDLRTWLRANHQLRMDGPHYHKYLDRSQQIWKDYRVPTYRLDMTAAQILRFDWSQIFPPGALDMSIYKEKLKPADLKFFDNSTDAAAAKQLSMQLITT